VRQIAFKWVDQNAMLARLGQRLNKSSEAILENVETSHEPPCSQPVLAR
jgi:hypothetical protein